MKKALKIFGAVILCSGVIALIVCLIAIPYQTNEFFAVVFEYLDKPIVLCGVSVTLGGILLYFITRYILSNSSVGKKHLKALEEELQAYKDKEKEDNINSLEKIAITNTNLLKLQDSFYDEKEKLENIIKLIPNKKVQEALNNGEEKKDN